jgi:hypothetical protein
MYFLCVWIGVLVWCAMSVGSTSMLGRCMFFVCRRVEYGVCMYGLVRVFCDIIGPVVRPSGHELFLC